jgi:hypothetical protein
LVELTREVLYGEVLGVGEVARVGDGVSDSLTKDAIAALLEELRCKTKKVVHIDVAQRVEVELEVEVELVHEALCFHLESRSLFYIDSIVCHD